MLVSMFTQAICSRGLEPSASAFWLKNCSCRNCKQKAGQGSQSRTSLIQKLIFMQRPKGSH